MKEKISTSDPHIKLRFAEKNDTGLILNFIKELADYEKLSHEVTTDENSLRKSLFESKRVAEVIIAEYKNEPAGFALFFHNFSTFLGKPGIYLEDLFVKPELRAKGIGKILLKYLTRIAVARDCGRLEWSVLDWNKPAIDFYKKLGAKSLDDWTVFRIDGKTLSFLASDFEN